MARATHILNVPIIGQKTSFACGNTVLACVLQYHRTFVSADELARLAGTEKTGTDHQNLVDAVKKLKLPVVARSGGGKKALRDVLGYIDRGLPVIVGWWSMGPGDVHYDKKWELPERKRRDAGHYSVLRGYTPSTLLFMDPQDGNAGTTIGYCAWSDEEFLPVWYDTDTDAYERVNSWYLVVGAKD